MRSHRDYLLALLGSKVHRLFQYLENADFTKKAYLKSRLFGFSFIFRPFLVNELFMALGIWEPYVRNELKLKSGNVFFDVGAHIGFYSLLASKMVGKKGLVVAVEPDPRNLHVLAQNVKLNKLGNIRIISKALSDKKHYTDFVLRNNPLLSEVKYRNEDDSQVIRVATTTINNIIDELKIKQIHLMKIDVEQSDYVVLKGGEESLNKIDRIIIEAQESSLALLKKMGFNIFELLHPYYLAESKDKKNFLPNSC